MGRNTSKINANVTWEWFSCFWCNQGKFQVNIPDNYDGKPPIRTVCQKPECQAKENLLKNEAKRQENISRLEEELNQSQVETEKLRKQLTENQQKEDKKYQEKSNQQPSSLSEPATDLNCNLCHKFIQDKYYEWAGPPKLVICTSCRPRFVANQVAMEYIMQGKNFNIESVEYLAPEDKITLRVLQKIKKGEGVNIDNLPLDELNKQVLKEFQCQNPSPKNNLSSNYLTKCKDCGKNYEVAVNPTRCYYCQSCNIETFKNGVLQPLSSDKSTTDDPVNNSPYLSWIVGGVVTVILLIPYLIWRKKKKKELEKQGKKMPWYY